MKGIPVFMTKIEINETKGLESINPSPSKNSEAVQAAVIRYYKLKGDYDAKYKNSKNKITKSGLSLSKIKKKLKSMKMKCINCKQNGGTIFTNKNGILTAKCGNTESSMWFRYTN